VWHASVFCQRGQPSRQVQTRRARGLLAGVGDRAHEWQEWTGRCVHLRRRLTPQEQQAIGAIRDLRGTPEAQARFATMRPWMNGVLAQLAKEEICSR
jgi:hypothetical protein